MKNISYFFAAAAACSMLTLGNAEACAQKNAGRPSIAGIRADLGRKVRMTSSPFAPDNFYPKKTKTFLYNEETGEFEFYAEDNTLEYIPCSSLVDEGFRMLSEGKKMYTRHTEKMNEADVPVCTVDENKFNEDDEFQNVSMVLTTYDDVVKDFTLQFEFYDWNATNETWENNSNNKKYYIITRDDQGRVSNVKYHSERKGSSYIRNDNTDFVYNDNNELTDIYYEDSNNGGGSHCKDIKMLETNHQYLPISGNSTLTYFDCVNCKPLSFVIVDEDDNFISSHDYSYDEEGRLISDSQVSVDMNDETAFRLINVSYTYGENGNYVRDYNSFVDSNHNGTWEEGEEIGTHTRTYAEFNNKGLPLKKVTYTVCDNGEWAEDGIKYEYVFNEQGLIKEATEYGTDFNTTGNAPGEPEFIPMDKVVIEEWAEVVPTGIDRVAKDSCNISYADGKLTFGSNTPFRIYDAQGRVCIYGNAMEMDTEVLAPGMYVVKAGSSSMKFVR